MKINNVEFNFNGTKLDDLQKIEDAYPELAEQVLRGQELMQSGKFATGARLQIKSFQKFFVDVTGVDVLAGCDDVAVAVGSFEQFQNDILEQRNRVVARYTKRR